MVNFFVFVQLYYRLGLSKAVSVNFLNLILNSESETMAWTEAKDKL